MAGGAARKVFGMPDTDRLERELRDRLDRLIALQIDANALIARIADALIARPDDPRDIAADAYITTLIATYGESAIRERIDNGRDQG